MSSSWDLKRRFPQERVPKLFESGLARESGAKAAALQTLRAVREPQPVAKRLECVRLQRRFSRARTRAICATSPRVGCYEFHGDVTL